MNKHITLLILLVVLCAMGLIVFFHVQSVPDGVAGLAQQQETPPPASSSDQENTTAPAQTARTPSDASATAGASSASAGSQSNVPAVSSATNASPTPVQPSRNAALPSIEPPISGRSEQGAAPGSSAAPSPSENAAPSPSAGASSSAERLEPSAQQRAENTPATPSTSAGSATNATPMGMTPSASQQPATPASASQQPTTPASASPGSAATAAAGKKAPEADLSLTGNHTLTNIGVHFSGQRMVLRIEADAPFPCKTFALSSPERLVVDLPGNWKGMRAPTVPANKMINGIRLGTQKTGPRLVLDLSKSAKYEVVRPSAGVVEVYVR